MKNHFWIALNCLVLCVCTSGLQAQPLLRVSVAASLDRLITERARLFESANACLIQINTGSSGELARQIMAAPAADVFISASEEWIDRLESSGKLIPGTRTVFLANRLVILAPADMPQTLQSLEHLPELPFQWLCIGDPAHVPAGKYAQQWLEAFRTPDGKTVWEAVGSRLLPAQDVRAALIQSQNLNGALCIVYQTDYNLLARNQKILLKSPEGHPAILYGMALVAGSSQETLAAKFLESLKSPESTQAFLKAGFGLP